MNLPRGWYAVAGGAPLTYRRHGLTSASGTLHIALEAPPARLPESCNEALELLRETLIRLHVSPGTPISSGCDRGAAGYLAFAVYKHLKRGQCEYWLIPHEDATVLASWEMGAMATAGMERHDIHEMLQKLHFEVEDDGEQPAETAQEAEPVADELEVGETPVVIDEQEAFAAEAEYEATHPEQASY